MNHTENDVRARIIRTILIALAVWGLLSFTIVFCVILLGSENIDERAVILEGGSLIFLWCIAGGLVFKRFRQSLITSMQRIAIPWGLRFVLLCILFAMLEEAVTTSLSNLAVHFLGASMKGIITASLNFWEVVGLHSVIVFVPMFIVWAFLLRRLDFYPAEVMLLFGLTGTLAETMSFGTQNLPMVGMWVFVYGLMVWIPASTIPRREKSVSPRWYHYPLAILLPLFGGLPAYPIVLIIRLVIEKLSGS